MSAPDHYKTLGVKPSASAFEIKKAFRSLSLTHHPDKNPEDKAAEEKYKQISAAYEVLSNATQKAEYDLSRKDTDNDVPHKAARAYYSSGSGRKQTAKKKPQFDTREPINIEVLFTLQEALTGTFKTVFYRRFVPCGKCKGTGACRYCSNGITTETASCPIEIPAGIADGEWFKIKGYGHYNMDSKTSGELWCTARMIPNEMFKRSGFDLLMDVSIDYGTIVLGGKVIVPTIDGNDVAVVISPGSEPGSVFRVKGKGLPVKQGSAAMRGDMLIKVRLYIPDYRQLSFEAIQCLDVIKQLPDFKK